MGPFGALGAIGKDVRPYLEPGRISWDEAMVPGGYIASERAKVMDQERIDMTLVYPSLGLVWEYDCDDPKVAAANCRAYNGLGLRLLQRSPDSASSLWPTSPWPTSTRPSRK